MSSRISEWTIKNSINFWQRMQINHNMGWNEIKGSFLINDKARWNICYYLCTRAADKVCTPLAKPQMQGVGTDPPTLSSGPAPLPQREQLTSLRDSQRTLIIRISGASNLLFTLSHASEKPGADRCTRNPKWQFWPPEVGSLQQNLVQPPGEMSGAPYGAGEINNKMEITAAAGSRNFWKKKWNLKMKKEK